MNQRNHWRDGIVSKVTGVFLTLFLALVSPAFSGPERELARSCRQIQRFYLLGTAGVTGGYFILGKALAREINTPGLDFQLIPESTGGSVSNLDFLLRGDLDLAFVQSDLIWNSLQQSALATAPLAPATSTSRRLLVLGALYPEVIQIVTRADRDVRSLSDLKGRRVAIGEEGSGTARNALMILSRAGLDASTVRIKHENPSRSASGLLNDELDALFLTGNLPSTFLQNLDTRIPLRMLPIPDDIREKLLAEHAFFTPELIPAGSCAQQAEDTPTIGLRALLVTTSDLPPAIAERLLIVLFDVFPGRRLGAVFDQLSLAKALDGIDSDLLHPSAVTFFSQRGIRPGTRPLGKTPGKETAK